MQQKKKLPLFAPIIFGEVLYDCFPDGREIAGGAPFNVAWNLQALGLSPLFLSRVGNDSRGEQIKQMMEKGAMDTSGLQIDPDLPTGKVTVTLQAGEPQFTVLPDQAYDRIVFRLPEELSTPCFLYHGSLALRNDTTRKTLFRIKEQVACPIFVDINLRDPWWSRELVFSLLQETTWLKLNEHELNTLFPGGGTIAERGGRALERFNLSAIFITLGNKGAMALTAEGGHYAVVPEKVCPVVDTVGAGDAFSSILLLGLVQDWPLPLTMERAQYFASAVIGRCGAITTERNFYTAIRGQWS
ncbi:MAG TPA: carbohydrate kinase [Desulfobulbaceae bacterium]|nr:carbohydrate kinase [Desulfobulbaceae bacterium]